MNILGPSHHTKSRAAPPDSIWKENSSWTEKLLRTHLFSMVSFSLILSTTVLGGRQGYGIQSGLLTANIFSSVAPSQTNNTGKFCNVRQRNRGRESYVWSRGYCEGRMARTRRGRAPRTSAHSQPRRERRWNMKAIKHSTEARETREGGGRLNMLSCYHKSL